MSEDLNTSRRLVKLRDILHAFADNCFPKDDTLVEKLHTWLQMWLFQTGSHKAFIQETSLDILMDQISRQQSLDPTTMAFFLKLGSYILSVAEGSNLRESILSLYKKVFSENLTNPCVVNAWLRGLDIMLHKCSFMKDWILEEGIHDKILSCLYQQSMFVTESAVELFSTLIAIDSCLQRTAASDDIKLRSLLADLFSNPKYDMNIKRACLQILQKAQNKAGELNSHKVYVDYKIFDKIFAVLEISDDSCSAGRNQAVHLLTDCKSHVTDEEVRSLEELVFRLVQSGSLQSAMTLAQWLVLNYEGKLKDHSKIREIQFMIISLTQKSNKDTCNGFDGEKTVVLDLLNKQKGIFPTLFLRQLELLVDYSQHKMLPSEQTEILRYVLEALCSGQCSENSLLVTLYKKQQKIYLALIDALSRIFQTEHDNFVPLICSIVQTCSDYLMHTSSSLVIQKTLQLLLVCIKCLKKAAPSNIKNVWSDISNMIQFLLCQTKWEILDSVTEFVTDLMLNIKDDEILKQLIESSLSRIIQLTENSESYLRASAISCLGALFTVSQSVWATVHAHCSLDALLDKVMCATKDEEAFPRRAAVKAIRSAYESNSFKSQSPELFSLMRRMISDPDWEVKCSCLEFWKAYVESIQSRQLTSADQQLQDLVDTGCVESLVKAGQDCDRTVQSKACELISIIREKYSPVISRHDGEGACAGSIKPNHVSALKELWTLDLLTLTEISNQSIDEYVTNPESLLDDVLRSVSNFERQDTGGGDDVDNAIDCY